MIRINKETICVVTNYTFHSIEMCIPREQVEQHYSSVSLYILTQMDEDELEKDIRLKIWAKVFKPKKRLRKINLTKGD